MGNRKVALVFFAVLCLLMAGCAEQKKLSALRKEQQKDVSINLPKEADFLPDNVSGQTSRPADTIVVKGEDGEEMILLNAIKDESSGEMVAMDVLDAAVVTARFRNKAERNGMIDIEFQVRVASKMLDKSWEMTLVPKMFIMQDSSLLDPIIITGYQHRNQQLRGYERYNKFLSSIISDTTLFIDQGLLERFIERNIPELYAFRSDSSYVTEEEFYSFYGVSVQEAIEHYTNAHAKIRNRSKQEGKDKKFDDFVKAPLPEKYRVNTVWSEKDGDYVYDYLETIKTRPKLRKVDVVVGGNITKQGKLLYTIPSTDTLSFYISSLSGFSHDVVRFKKEVIYRKATANTSYEIVFPVGKTNIVPGLAKNASEINRIKENLTHLVANDVFDLDSIVVTANASPEGSYSSNHRLSQGRSAAVSSYFDAYMRHIRDSIKRERGFSIDEFGNVVKDSIQDNIRFLSRAVAENWTGLDELFEYSEHLDDTDRETYRKLRASVFNMDALEINLRKQKFGPYMRDSLYPRLRTVSFDFHLHRKGMVKDTVETNVVDDVYQEGLQALKDRDYERAVELLMPYEDYNTAVAYLAMDRNYNALEILKKEPKTAEVNYMMAILHARQGNMQDAVNCYLESCRQDGSYVFRGNLDPEISMLIKTYGLNKQPEEDDLYAY